MLRVKLDTSAVAARFGAQAEDVLQTSIDRLEVFARDSIRTRVDQAKLSRGAAQDYVEALRVEKQPFVTTLSIDDPRIERFESGVPPFDIKTGLLAGPSVKHTKSGRPYADVPFAHRLHARAPGKGTVVPAGTMRNIVNRAVSIAKTASSGFAQRLFKAKRGRSNIRSDMKVTSRGGGQVDVQTFRRVSENSDPAKWMHPGWEGVHAFEETAKEVERIKDKVVEAVAKEKGLL